jgi:hypothetical protein
MAEKEFVRAIAGKRDWTGYTLTLKAWKNSGAAGFLILFRINQQRHGRLWSNQFRTTFFMMADSMPK